MHVAATYGRAPRPPWLPRRRRRRSTRAAPVKASLGEPSADCGGDGGGEAGVGGEAARLLGAERRGRLRSEKTRKIEGSSGPHRNVAITS